LIPTSGINGAEEQERRATSALLAVVSAVKEFGRSLLSPLGAPAGVVETYIEVPFVLGDKKLYPDGLVRVSRGQRSWTALIEVKTGTNALASEQLENCLDIAREQGFDAVITISNEVPAVRGQHPTAVDRRRLRRVALHHLPWVEVLAEAVMQKEFRGVADPDQAWILGELIATWNTHALARCCSRTWDRRGYRSARPSMPARCERRTRASRTSPPSSTPSCGSSACGSANDWAPTSSPP
jgi:hypothetical protein